MMKNSGFWVLGATILGCIAPILMGPDIPGMDIPNHLAIAHTLVSTDQPFWHERFESNLTLKPYVTYYGVMFLLCQVLSAMAASTLLTIFYVSMFALAFYYLLTGIAEDHKWMVMWAPLLIFSDSYFVGFTNYYLGIPILLGTLGLAVRAAKHERVQMPQLAVLAAGFIGLYFTHPILCLGAPVLVAPLLIATLCNLRRMLIIALTQIPSIILFGLWYLDQPPSENVKYATVGFNLEYFFRSLWIVMPTAWVYIIGGLIMGAFFFAAKPVLETFKSRGKHSSINKLRLLAPAAAWIIGGGVFMFLPAAIGSTSWLNLRLAPLIWLLGFVSVGPFLTRSLPGRVLVGIVAILQVASVSSVHMAFNRELEPLKATIEAMEPNKTILPLMFSGSETIPKPFYTGDRRVPYASHFSYFRQFGSYYHAVKGGVSPWMTFSSTLAYIPLNLKDEFLRNEFNTAGPFVPERVIANVSQQIDKFDYILAMGMSQRLKEKEGRHIELVGSNAGFTVFRPL